jgi:copper chaperone
MATVTYAVKGMTCDHCVGSVTAEVEKVPGITDIKVDVKGGLLTLEAGPDLDDQAVREAVEEAGYEAVPV